MIIINNNFKKWFIIETIFIITFGTILHFVYEWSGNNQLIGIFGAINESTWEHLKLLFWPSLIFGLFEFFIFGKNYDNFIPAKAISIYLGIVLIIIIFNTYTGVIGQDYLFVDILTYLISVIISQYVGYKILTSKKYISSSLQLLSTIAIMILILAFVFFTFNPPKIKLFEDLENDL